MSALVKAGIFHFDPLKDDKLLHNGNGLGNQPQQELIFYF